MLLIAMLISRKFTTYPSQGLSETTDNKQYVLQEVKVKHFRAAPKCDSKFLFTIWRIPRFRLLGQLQPATVTTDLLSDLNIRTVHPCQLDIEILKHLTTNKSPSSTQCGVLHVTPPYLRSRQPYHTKAARWWQCNVQLSVSRRTKEQVRSELRLCFPLILLGVRLLCFPACLTHVFYSRGWASEFHCNLQMYGSRILKTENSLLDCKNCHYKSVIQGIIITSK